MTPCSCFAVDLRSTHSSCSSSTEGPSGDSDSTSVDNLSLPDVGASKTFKKRSEFAADGAYAVYVKENIQVSVWQLSTE